VDAAVSIATERSDSIGLAGWSFGAAVAMNWLIENQSETPYAGIAPPVTLINGTPPKGTRRIILGSREQVIDSDALMAFAIDNGIDLLITPGDHFFHGRGKRIGDLVGEGLEAGAAD
jgi:uncharacterized protein